MADETPGPDKTTLRNTARAKRAAFTVHEIETMSRQVCRNLLPQLDGNGPVLVYVSKPLEVQTRSLIDTLLDRKRRVVVPIIEKENRSLRLSYLTDPAHLVESTFHVPEPIGNEIPADPRDVLAVIVPVLAFDSRGHRLGYGAGYYDRFLARYPHMKKIGLAFSCQQVPMVPHDNNDIRMDYIVTEKGIADCCRESAG